MFLGFSIVCYSFQYSSLLLFSIVRYCCSVFFVILVQYSSLLLFIIVHYCCAVLFVIVAQYCSVLLFRIVRYCCSLLFFYYCCALKLKYLKYISGVSAQCVECWLISKNFDFLSFVIDQMCLVSEMHCCRIMFSNVLKCFTVWVWTHTSYL